MPAQNNRNDSLAFGMFILLNMVLFVRPQELFSSLEEVPIYQMVILVTIAFSLSGLTERLTLKSLSEHPIDLCVLGLLPAGMLACIFKLYTWEARDFFSLFGKIIIYYFLGVSLLNSVARIKTLLLWMTFIVGILATIAVLQYHEVVYFPNIGLLDIPSIDPSTGEVSILRRMRSSGIFNDPNDLCLVLTLGIISSVFFLTNKKLSGARFFFLLPISFFFYALTLTKSRGGMLGFLAVLSTLAYARFGWKKALFASVIFIPLILTAVGGRQTEFDLNSQDTGQERVQIWSQGFSAMKYSPLFGIGYAKFEDTIGHAAHNSFVHAYVELGLFGGSLFFGAFFLGISTLYRLNRPGVQFSDEQFKRMRPYIMSILVGYVTGMFSLSRCYIEPTYLTMAFASSFSSLAAKYSTVSLPRFNAQLILRIFLMGLAGLVTLYAGTRILVRWN